MARDEMIKQIQMLKFYLIDLGLYLDTHTFDKEIIGIFNDYKEEYCNLVKMYEQQYGPLTVGTTREDFWNWTQNPWPWDFE